MEFARQDTHGLFSCSIKFTTKQEISNLTDEVEGEVAITSTHKESFQYPVSISIQNQAGFLSFGTTEKQVKSESEFPVRFPFITTAGKNTKHIEIDSDISGVEGFKTEKPLPSSEFLNSYSKILTEGNSDTLVETIEKGFDDQFQQEDVRGNPLRNKADDYTTFQQYMEIISFLHEYGNSSNINESRSLKKRLLMGEFQTESYGDLKNALEEYSEYDSLGEVTVDDIFSEALLDMWDFDNWSEEVSGLPNVAEVNTIVERYFDGSLFKDLSRENLAHLLVGLYISDESNMIKKVVDKLGGDFKYDYNTFAGRKTLYFDSDLHQSGESLNLGKVAHFLYSKASSFEQQNEMNKKCASLYYKSSILFSESDIRGNKSWSKEAEIRSHHQRGYPYKTHPKAFEHFSEATRIYDENIDILEKPPKDVFLRAARQASKAIVRQMRNSGDLDLAVERIISITDRISDELEDFDNYNNVQELYGYKYAILAERDVQKGDFTNAKMNIEKSKKNFKQVRYDTKLIDLDSIKLQESAVEGLIEEKKGNFATASDKYSTGSKDIAEEYKTVYEIWSELAEAKNKLVDGQIADATQIITQIEETFGDVRLIDLQKLEILIDLLDDYKEDVRSDNQKVFERIEEVDGEPLPQKHIVQYNTNYSVGYTMLLTRQRHKEIGMDRGKDEEFFRSLEDAVTPTGIDTDGKNRGDGGTAVAVTQSRTESQSENTVQKSADNGGNQQPSTSGINKTRNRSQNRSYDAFEEDSDETIAYESHVEQTQEGAQVHEEAIDIVEDYLVAHGFRGGETDRSDLLVINNENIILVEAKYITSENETYQTRKAVGQLLEYRYRDVLQDEKLATMDLTLWLLLTQSPTSSFEPILKSYQDMGIYTLWIDDGEIEGFKTSIDKLNQIID